ncbi:hypothetical protein JK358_22175 [Nocardia sp. 2]|uniref:HIRAN domain-containing protein n=1 Tax=Nocardia acididurans TaxID=2802282 RepID=A0ABS1MAD7_9NOCA|nr:hypothetical protein [Nocardia acididurans]MBL1077110.1 hypothetical protein [Nocardia acididurans]
MDWSKRLFTFAGGFLETNAYGDESDHTGVYFEHYGTGYQEDRQPDAVRIRYKPTALGYIRTDVSGIAQLWDEAQVRATAARLGYDFAEMVVYDPRSGRPPFARLKYQATRLAAEAVIVPSPDHFEGGCVPESLGKRLEVITVWPG